jgi:DNA-binding MarR family transcriptional regulator
MIILCPFLTPRQRQVYEYLRTSLAERGYAPTVREIAAHFGLRSARSVMAHLRPLERQGFVQRLHFTTRAIWLVPGEEAGEEAMRVLPRPPTVRPVGEGLVVDLGTATVALGRDEALRLARALRDTANRLPPVDVDA